MANISSIPFILSYARPWKDNFSLSDAWGNYLRDKSLVDYGTDRIKSSIQEAAHSLGIEISQATRQLEFLNWQTSLLLEQQRLANLKLSKIVELLKIPDSEKERQQEISLGIQFFKNASKNPLLYFDSLQHLLRAEQLKNQDYFVLNIIGKIYLYSPNNLDLNKAIDYFNRASMYAEVEGDSSAIRNTNALEDNSLFTSENIYKLVTDSYKSIAIASYILGRDSKAIEYQTKVLERNDSPENRFLLAKYLVRKGDSEGAVRELDIAIEKKPEIFDAIFLDKDTAEDDKVLSYVNKKVKEINLAVDDALDLVLDKRSPTFSKQTAYTLFILSSQKPFKEKVNAIKSVLQPQYNKSNNCYRWKGNWLTKTIEKGSEALRIDRLSTGVLNDVEYRLSLKVDVIDDKTNPLLILKFRSKNNNELPDNICFKIEDNHNRSDNLSSTSSTKDYSVVHKDYVIIHHIQLTEADLLKLFRNEAHLVIAYPNDSFDSIKIDRDDSVLFLRLKTEFLPNSITEEQKEIISQDDLKALERINKENTNWLTRIDNSNFIIEQERDILLSQTVDLWKTIINEIDDDVYDDLESRTIRFTYRSGWHNILWACDYGSQIVYPTDFPLLISKQVELLAEKGIIDSYYGMSVDTDDDSIFDEDYFDEDYDDDFVDYHDLFSVRKCTNKTIIISLKKKLDSIKVLSEKIGYTKKSTLNTPDSKSNNPPSKAKKGCYIATCIYGSYDCPEVWTLRRFRDNILKNKWYGRLFIHLYYSISPKIVKWFGKSEFFKSICKPFLDKIVKILLNKGISNFPYVDK